MTGPLENHLRTIREQGRKALVPYITGGYPGWEEAIRAAAANGADAVEIGIPFSDPVMDGPVIQQASQAALDGGTTPLSVLERVPEPEPGGRDAHRGARWGHPGPSGAGHRDGEDDRRDHHGRRGGRGRPCRRDHHAAA